MGTARGRLAAATIAASLAVGACGPIRLDSRPQMHGSLAAVHAEAVDVRHKTGRIYRVGLTRDTRIVYDNKTSERSLCPGQRVTVLLVGRGQFTASSVTIWSGRCE